MLEITSTECGKHQHAEFRLRFDPKLARERDARDLVALLEQRAASAHPPKPGEHFPFGWTSLYLREAAPGLLAVEGPDMASLPVQYVDSLTAALRHFRWQKDCAASIGAANSSAFPGMFQSATICRRLVESDSFLMERRTGTEADSGWFIGCADSSHEHERPSETIRLPLYEAVVRFHESVAAFLALPVGAKVLSGPQGLWISHSGRSFHVRPGSLPEDLLDCLRTARTATVLVDAGHNLLESPAGEEMPAYRIPASQRLILKCTNGYTIPPLPEFRARGIEAPNTALLLTKNGNYRQPWTAARVAQFDLNRQLPPDGEAGLAFPSVQPGDEIIAIIGYIDPAPHPVTKGGIAAMWSAQVRMVSDEAGGAAGSALEGHATIK